MRVYVWLTVVKQAVALHYLPAAPFHSVLTHHANLLLALVYFLTTARCVGTCHLALPCLQACAAALQ
jgi:hypothetical protein